MGRPAKLPITREQIIAAMQVTRSNRAAARYLHASYQRYRQYAQLYTDENGVSLYEKHKNPSGKGIPKFTLNTTGRIKKEPPIMDILEGRVSPTHFSPQQLKYRLIQMGLLKPECSRCGYSKARLLDGRSPLILQHKNGEKNDWHLDNLEFICYNCAFLEGPNTAITEEMVERAEDGIDRNGPKITEQTYELDEYQEEYLRKLFNDEPQSRPGEEYIAKF